MDPEEFHRGFDSWDWAPPDVDLEEFSARFYELTSPHMHPAASIPREYNRVLARWILKYWTLRWPSGGMPPAE